MRRGLRHRRSAVYDAVNAVDPKYAMYGGVTATASGGLRRCRGVRRGGNRPGRPLPGSGGHVRGRIERHDGGDPRRGGPAIAGSRWVLGREPDRRHAEPTTAPTRRSTTSRGKGPGDWPPTPPAYAQAVDPQWGNVTPFALTSGSQFQPPPPPSITSAQYAQEVNQVETLGGTTSTVRTADKTATALFWSDVAGTFDPPGHWNQITETPPSTAKSNLVGLGPRVRAGQHRPGRRRHRDLERQVYVQHGAAGDGDPRRGQRRQPPDHGRPDLDAPLDHARVPVLHVGT